MLFVDVQSSQQSEEEYRRMLAHRQISTAFSLSVFIFFFVFILTLNFPFAFVVALLFLSFSFCATAVYHRRLQAAYLQEQQQQQQQRMAVGGSDAGVVTPMFVVRNESTGEAHYVTSGVTLSNNPNTHNFAHVHNLPQAERNATLFGTPSVAVVSATEGPSGEEEAATEKQAEELYGTAAYLPASVDPVAASPVSSVQERNSHDGGPPSAQTAVGEEDPVKVAVKEETSK